MMKRLGIVLLVASLMALPALGQRTGDLTLTGNGQCQGINLQAGSSGSVKITVSGTWSATVQPEEIVSGKAAQNIQVTPSASTTAQSTITTNDYYMVLSKDAAGADTIQVCTTAYVSGTVVVSFTVSTASAGLGGGGGGGGSGTVTSVSGNAGRIVVTNPTTTPNIDFDNPLVTRGIVTIPAGTLTTDKQPLLVTATYNNALQIFNGSEDVVIDQAHAAGSYEHQWFCGVAGTTQCMTLDLSGNVVIPGTSQAQALQAVGTGAGLWACTQGASSIGLLPVNSGGFMCPTGITTSWVIQVPAAAATSPGVFAIGAVSGQIMLGTFSQAPILGTDNSVAGSIQLANNAANAHTIWGSGATTSNTVNGPATSPANGDALCSTIPTSNVMTISDCGFVGSNAVTAVSPGAGIAHFAGSTQAVTSSAIVNADITSMAESKLTGSLGATTITESAASFSITRAGVATANLTAPYVFLNTNSTNSNTSIGLGISTPGTSTGQTTLNINGAATGGDLMDCGTGGTWTAGVLSGQTILCKISITGAFTGVSYTSNGTTAGFLDLPQGTTSSGVAPCNTATSICLQAPTSVTSQLRTFAGTPATGFSLWTNTAGSMVETLTPVEGTISAGPFLFGASAINTVIAQTIAVAAGHFTNLIITSSLGGACTTSPTFNVFDGTTNTGTAKLATSTTQTKGTSTSQTQTQTFAAGDLIGIYISVAGATCTTDTWTVEAEYSTP